MELLNETFNEVYVDCDNDNDSYTREYIQLDMFKDYTMAIVLPRDEDDDYWFSDYCATVFIGTNRYSVEDKFTDVLQNHPTNVGRFLLIDQPLHKLYNKEW
jgi:hypothetical protein|tara:strand:+ start:573 stop:875 length:303 start_codon:yes stop_codon:yes gene_type:complete